MSLKLNQHEDKIRLLAHYDDSVKFRSGMSGNCVSSRIERLYYQIQFALNCDTFIDLAEIRFYVNLMLQL